MCKIVKCDGYLFLKIFSELHDFNFELSEEECCSCLPFRHMSPVDICKLIEWVILKKESTRDGDKMTSCLATFFSLMVVLDDMLKWRRVCDGITRRYACYAIERKIIFFLNFILHFDLRVFDIPAGFIFLRRCLWCRFLWCQFIFTGSRVTSHLSLSLSSHSFILHKIIKMCYTHISGCNQRFIMWRKWDLHLTWWG